MKRTRIILLSAFGIVLTMALAAAAGYGTVLIFRGYAGGFAISAAAVAAFLFFVFRVLRDWIPED